MKKLLIFMFLLLFSAFNAHDAYYPILMTRSDLEASVKLTNSAMLLTQPGKNILVPNAEYSAL